MRFPGRLFFLLLIAPLQFLILRHGGLGLYGISRRLISPRQLVMQTAIVIEFLCASRCGTASANLPRRDKESPSDASAARILGSAVKRRPQIRHGLFRLFETQPAIARR